MAQTSQIHALQLERLTTGVSALDDVLQGGIPRGSVVFVAGLPGTGKTVLCEQMAWANARQGERVLYLTTLSEPMVKILRFSQTFTFFDAELLGKNMVFGDLGTILRQEPEGVLDHLGVLVQEHRPSLLVIDSFKAVRESFSTPSAFRAFALDLMIRLPLWEVTSVLIGEYNEADVREQLEFAIADGIIYLYGTEEVERQKRMLRVMKMRGTSFFSGEHVFDITHGGMTLFPRMHPEVVGEYHKPGGRLPSAIIGLTEMLDGGVFDATVTLLVGSSGTGKTLTALSFLAAALSAGRRGLLISMEESAGQIMRNAETFDWGLADAVEEGRLAILHVSPSELDLDRHAAVILNEAESSHADCIVIDSVSSIRQAAPDPAKFQSFLWAVNDYFKRKGVTVIMTQEQGADEPEESARHISLYADTIVRLRLLNMAGRARRVISVRKMRGSGHDDRTRELIIQPPEMRIGELIDGSGPNGRAPA